MEISSACMLCLMGKQKDVISNCSDEKKKQDYLKKAFFRFSQAGPDDCAPVLHADLNKIAKETFENVKSYQEEKDHYNQLMLAILPEIEKKIRNSKDPLEAAIKYARAGNYIDFGAVAEVKEDQLFIILEQATEEELSPDTYTALKEELSKASQFVYVTDNCGEVVMDMALIKLLKELYPKLMIQVLVRGCEAINDATIEDAKFIGLTKVSKVIGNGSDVPGTALQRISTEALQILEKADLIFAKGQGNFESLYGAQKGYTVYYLFLCKCDYFTEKFGLKKFSGVFMREQQTKTEIE
ncbi:MAG: ARMT1-like domain-containing protein [Lachnospiraceae bacterium]|nr:ARMT1-like domain-containing protein [Lachnospiraceae bacterium]